MSAAAEIIKDGLFKQAEDLSAEVRQPFPRSRKIYVQGSRPDILVPMREVTQTPTRTAQGEEHNPPLTVYDTSGPYTDPAARIDLLAGLPALRAGWIAERGDTEELKGPTSIFGRIRAADERTSHLRFGHIRKPLRAKAGANVSQMHYARRGLITPEMEYIAIRENTRLEELRETYSKAGYLRQHQGQSFGASIP